MLNNLYRFGVDDIEINHEMRYVGLTISTRLLRVPFYDINQVSVFDKRISMQYKKSMNAIYRAEESTIKEKQKEFERAGISMRNAT